MDKLKKRKLVLPLLDCMEDKEVLVIHGSRQVGKTSLLHYIISECLPPKVPQSNVFYFDLEDFQLLDLCNTSPDEVIAYLKAKGADFSGKVYLFIDEIQYLGNPSSFLKLFHDRYKEKVKLIVSGSSSFLIKKKFKDSLAGRVLDFELFALDFEEFLWFKGLNYDLSGRLPDNLQGELKRLYAEFLVFGGYPAIVLEDIVEKKEMKLKQIINAYIKKDIRDLAGIRAPDKFNALLKMLASQAGNLLNMLELSNTLGLAKQTVEEYVFLLEQTYIIRRVKPFHKNIRSELSKMPKIFFEDTGIANILANKTFSSRVDSGLLENSVYSQLRKNLPVEDVHFWRTAGKREIDFVVDFSDIARVLLAIEVKSVFLNKYASHIRYFKKEYAQTKACFCCLEQRDTAGDKDLSIVYPWQLVSWVKDFNEKITCGRTQQLLGRQNV